MSDQIAYERPDVPDTVKSRPPTPTRCAIEKFGLPDAWQECRWEKKGLNKDASDFRYLEIEGAVYPHRKASGKYKGDIDWKRPEDGTKMTVSITKQEIDTWMARWEAETGFCQHCSGTGFSVAGWNAERGVRYRPCSRCKQSGRSA